MKKVFFFFVRWSNEVDYFSLKRDYIDIFFFLLEINLCVCVYLSGDVGIIFKYVDYDFKY